MKSVLISQIALVFSGIALAAADVALTIKVTDDFGKPLPGIVVRMSTYARTIPSEAFGKDVYKNIKAKTDSRGIAMLKGESRLKDVGVGIPPIEGFYYTRGGTYSFQEVKNGKWQPWNPTIELVLKPILNPVPVYFSTVDTHVKKANQKFGFDLMMEDWIAPDGNGRITDLEIEVRGYWKSSTNYDSTLLISFPNPQDGIQEFELLRPGTGSDLRSPRYAPIRGYRRELHLRKVRDEVNRVWTNDVLKEHGYFLRIRSATNEQGQLQRAVYGKIDHGFAFGGAVDGSYLKISSLYLSPEPNSTNMEFDLKRTLPKPGKR